MTVTLTLPSPLQFIASIKQREALVKEGKFGDGSAFKLDIGNLTVSIIGSSGIRATVQHMGRFAWLVRYFPRAVDLN